MEPADQRREHYGREAAARTADLAAMEPADQRREHPAAVGEIDVRRGAAMEPADQRREHLIPVRFASWAREPQWSPPTSGGSTRRRGGQ